MSQQMLYDLIFKAELIRGFDEVLAKRNIAALFKISEQKVAVLFSGQPVVLKRGLDLEAANKFRVAIKKAGCRVDVIEQKTKPADGEQQRPRAPLAAASAVKQKPSTEQAAASSDFEQPANANTLSMAPAGTPVLAESERRPVQAVDVDVSGMSVRNMEGDLLDDSERVHIETPTIDTSDLSVAQAGDDLLRAEERKVVESLELDLSELSVASVGEDLGEVNEKKPKLNPETGHLTLVRD